jgi:hypothetical protein
MSDDRIDEILSTMDIPAMRRDTGDISNLRWLNRNVGIQNARHPQFRELRNILNQLLAIGE